MKTTIFVIIQVLSLSSTVFADNSKLLANLQDMSCAEIHDVMVDRRAEATHLAKESQPLMKLNRKDQMGLAMQEMAIEKLVQADLIESVFVKKCVER